MVGLVSNTNLSSIENKAQTMSDSSGKEDVADKSDKPLSNGTETKDEAVSPKAENEKNSSMQSDDIKTPEVEEEEEEMEEEEDEKTEGKGGGGGDVIDLDGEDEDEEEDGERDDESETDEEADSESDDTEEQNEVTSHESARRKSRSSRSLSNNSSSSPAPTNRLGDDTNASTKSDNEDPDFLGFESSNIEALKERIEKLSHYIGPREKDDDFLGLARKIKPAVSGKRTNARISCPPSAKKNRSKQRKGSKKSLSVDLSNPDLKKPFEYGWVRELVYRSTSDSSIKRNADIYYYTPSGKKVRSSREILEHLTGDLTLENFTFFKEPIGVNNPTKEIIREAKSKPGPRSAEDGSPKMKKNARMSITPTPPREKAPKEASSTKTSSTPKVVFRAHASPKSARTPLPAKAKLDKKRKSAGPDDVDIIMDVDEWSPEQKNDPAREVCSIECRLAMGLIPTLQCHVCLCLYHPECCGFQRDKVKINHSYVCKNCQVMKITPTVSLPPAPQLTPIVAPVQAPAKRAAKQATAPTSQAQAQPMSSSSSSTSSVPRPANIVGGVTTWLAPSSSIQVTPQVTATLNSADAPQGLIRLDGKEFVFLPKQNVVNVNTQQGPSESGAVSNPPGLFLVPCDPRQQLQEANGPSPSDPSPSENPLTNGIKRANDSPTEDSTPVKKMKPSSDSNEETDESTSSGKASSQNFMMNVNAGFLTLLQSFRYLKVSELLRASCVSKMWQFVASHHSLWETVRMKNSRVSDWKGFGRTLSSHGTKYLDLRKMLVPETPEELAKMWDELLEALKDVKTLVRIDMGRCSPLALTSIPEAAPQLESLISLAIKGNELDLFPLIKCKNLKELKLKAVSGGLELKNISCLKNFSNLNTLALTTIKNLKGIENCLPEGLISLELGECSQLSPAFATDALPKLTKLRRLRLEKGQNECPTMALLQSVALLDELKQLELINFDIKPGFEKALSRCTNLRTLLIIPTYVTQSATTNHVVMGGVAKLSHTLTYFIWGLTLELLKVTDLFIGQVENQKKGGNAATPPKKTSGGDSIPILKPSGETELKEGNQAPSQVDILALPNLQRVLSTLLPTTKIKILKVPFSATWRQTVTGAP